MTTASIEAELSSAMNSKSLARDFFRARIQRALGWIFFIPFCGMLIVVQRYVLGLRIENLAEHRMHAEYGEVDQATADALNAAKTAGGRIVCVGTTSLRLLESATGEDGVVRACGGETAIFITPGYRFRAADGLMTNFHLPKSTLFMLVSAFAGLETMRAAYAHAIAGGYRFYSYGDASLLWRAD